MTSWDPLMSGYCKAFSVATLRRFPGWPVEAENRTAPQDEADRGICFVHEDFLVTWGVLRTDEETIMRGDTQEWREFCENELRLTPRET